MTHGVWEAFGLGILRGTFYRGILSSANKDVS